MGNDQSENKSEIQGSGTQNTLGETNPNQLQNSYQENMENPGSKEKELSQSDSKTVAEKTTDS